MIPLLLSLVTYLPANEYLNGVQLNVGAQYENHTMKLTGYAIGLKKIGPMMHAKVAVNEFFTEKPEFFVRTEAGVANSLSNVGMMNMHLTFLRTLDSSLVQGMITEYLSHGLTADESNKYKSDIDNVVKAIGVENAIYAGKSISVTGDVLSNTIAYSNSAGDSTVIHSQNMGFVLTVFKLWFGNPQDNDAFNLRLNLLRDRNVTGVVP